MSCDWCSYVSLWLQPFQGENVPLSSAAWWETPSPGFAASGKRVWSSECWTYSLLASPVSVSAAPQPHWYSGRCRVLWLQSVFCCRFSTRQAHTHTNLNFLFFLGQLLLIHSLFNSSKCLCLCHFFHYICYWEFMLLKYLYSYFVVSQQHFGKFFFCFRFHFLLDWIL